MKKKDDDGTTSSDDLDLLVQKLRWLRLPGMAKVVAAILERAAKENLSTTDVVHRLCDRGEAEPHQERRRPSTPRCALPRDQHRRRLRLRLRPGAQEARARYLALHDLDFLDKGINPLSSVRPAQARRSSARALAYKACLDTRRVVFVSAPRMLSELHGAELHGVLDRALRRFVRAELPRH